MRKQAYQKTADEIYVNVKTMFVKVMSYAVIELQNRWSSFSKILLLSDQPNPKGQKFYFH